VSTWEYFAQPLLRENSSGLPMILPSPLGRKKCRRLVK
jgi:hypothetical protein